MLKNVEREYQAPTFGPSGASLLPPVWERRHPAEFPPLRATPISTIGSHLKPPLPRVLKQAMSLSRLSWRSYGRQKDTHE